MFMNPTRSRVMTLMMARKKLRWIVPSDLILIIVRQSYLMEKQDRARKHAHQKGKRRRRRKKKRIKVTARYDP
jgi:hypothetical protein